MFWQVLSLSGFPNGLSSRLNMTADFAPLFTGMIIGVGFFILGLAVALAIHDTWWTQQKAKKITDEPVPLLKAA
jgi:hypothetical protein